MGTFHIIDGSRVKIYYPGNKKTCGRCHQTADICKGEAIARDCESNGGLRIDINDHMKKLWHSVGFEPFDFDLKTDDATTDVQIEERVKFSPQVTHPVPSSKDKN